MICMPWDARARLIASGSSNMCVNMSYIGGKTSLLCPSARLSKARDSLTQVQKHRKLVDVRLGGLTSTRTGTRSVEVKSGFALLVSLKLDMCMTDIAAHENASILQALKAGLLNWG